PTAGRDDRPRREVTILVGSRHQPLRGRARLCPAPSVATMRSVHIVPHTHWDREWYKPFPLFRMQLVELVDLLLDTLDKDDRYRHFQLDGQMAVIDDYLEIRPNEAGRLRRLNEAGRTTMGPWYTLPDEFLVSGETHV